jgi:hypothetical protein
MAAKRKPAKLKKSAFVGVKFTDEEHGELLQELEPEESLSAYIRKLVRTHPDRKKRKAG